MKMNQTKLSCSFNSYFHEKGEEIVLSDTQATDSPSWGIQSHREIGGFNHIET